MPRRRPGSLFPVEVGILGVCLSAGERGEHGFAIAKVLAEQGDDRQLTATGTLYRALHRLEESGLVESWWEDPEDAATDGRPRRRLYRLTGAGATALAASRAEAKEAAAAKSLRPGMAT